MIEVPSAFHRMPRWWADEAGRAWLDDLPRLVALQCARWGLTVDGSAMHGSNALVVPVRRSHERLALRLAPPGTDVAAEIRALRTWDGGVVVRLVDADEAAGTMLLERLDSGRSLADQPLREAVRVLGSLTRALAVPVPEDVESTADIAVRERDSFETRWLEVDRPAPEHHLRAAVDASSALAGSRPGSTAVDGDLHFGQVLAGRRAPWTVVDPLLLRGDPEYDLGRILWSRLDEVDGHDALVELFDVFVAAAGVPPERAARWVVVRAMSYLLWGVARGLTLDPPRCRRLLDVFS